MGGNFILQNDTMFLNVSFSPTVVGAFLDTITITTQECNYDFKLVVSGTAVVDDIVSTPSAFNEKVATNIVKNLSTTLQLLSD